MQEPGFRSVSNPERDAVLNPVSCSTAQVPLIDFRLLGYIRQFLSPVEQVEGFDSLLACADYFPRFVDRNCDTSDHLDETP